MSGESGTTPLPSLYCDNIARSFGGLTALKGISLGIERAQIFGLVGPNGSGKTTLVNAITGFYPPQQGRILYDGGDITGERPHPAAPPATAPPFQNPALFPRTSLIDPHTLGQP